MQLLTFGVTKARGRNMSRSFSAKYRRLDVLRARPVITKGHSFLKRMPRWFGISLFGKAVIVSRDQQIIAYCPNRGLRAVFYPCLAEERLDMKLYGRISDFH